MQAQKVIKLKIEGMTCVACKEKIEKKLLKLKGVLSARVMLEINLAEIEYNPGKVSVLEIKDSIESLDYKIIEEINNFAGSKNKKDMMQMLGIGTVAIVLYLVINNTIGFNFIPDITNEMGLGFLFVVGLFTSLHCVSMCGGINLSQCMPKKEGDSRAIPSIMYNLGRVISYTVLGGIVGGIGSAVSFSNAGKGLIAVLAGVFMVIMGLNMLNVFPVLRKITPQMPLFVRKVVNSEKQGKGPFVVGLLNGFIPCGPLQAMQIYALGTGSVVMGALSMFFFSLGTVPLMYGLGTLGAFLGAKFTHKMIKVSGILVIILGIIMTGRGLALSGYNTAILENLATKNVQSERSELSDQSKQSSNNASNNLSNNPSNNLSNNPSNKSNSFTSEIKDGKQIIVSSLKWGRYQPITVKKGIPVKWIINAKKEEINGCNNVLVVPKYNIEKRLSPGENIIEFTPDEEGIIPYSCWMGMIRSKITVEKE